MMPTENTKNIITRLQKDISVLEGYKPANSASVDKGLGPLTEAFPNGSFPLGTVHEFLCVSPEVAAATHGFAAGLLSLLMGSAGTSLWISSSRTLFPPALKNFGLQPDRIIFIDLKREKDVAWAMEEALKCGALTAVIGELKEISFTTSRRLQLAVEQSRVTGFILRSNSIKINTTACTSRWKIAPLPSELIDDLPGIGFPSWKVELLRIRNGRARSWNIKWEGSQFVSIMPIGNAGEKRKSENSLLPLESSNATNQTEELGLAIKTG
jgi:protein ImuA